MNVAQDESCELKTTTTAAATTTLNLIVGLVSRNSVGGTHSIIYGTASKGRKHVLRERRRHLLAPLFVTRKRKGRCISSHALFPRRLFRNFTAGAVCRVSEVKAAVTSDTQQQMPSVAYICTHGYVWTAYLKWVT